MAGQMQTISIPCRGGLDLASNRQELLGKPGAAIRLSNFEPSKQGGYRRISGYEQYGTVEVPGTGRTLGISNYNNNAVVVAKDDGIYHSFDGTYWVQVNYDSTNVDEATMLAGTLLPRTGAERYMIARADVGLKQYLFMVDGVNTPSVLSVEGATRPSASYRYKELTDDSGGANALEGAKYCVTLRNQLVLAGMPGDPTSFYYSSVASTDLTSPEDDDKEIPHENFNGATSGSASVGDIITGLAIQRDVLYIFCRYSIYKAVNLDSGELRIDPITRNIGCVDGFTIQEIGGDLVFLAPDGLRTIAKTDRIDDVELGVISRNVSKILDPRLREADRYEFSSTVIREKNQYRMWYTDLANTDLTQRGIIAAYTYTPTDQSFSWDFAEMESLGCTTADNWYFEGKERIIFGNQAGEVNVMEEGFTFRGTRIPYLYQSPFVDMGDISIRKNIHTVFINTSPEGPIRIGLEVRFDYQSDDVFQPAVYPMEEITMPSIFGDPLVTFGDPLVLFGVSEVSDSTLYTEGSGFVISFRVSSLDQIDDSSFDIQSLQVELTPGGKV